MARTRSNPRRTLFIAAAILLILALLPSRFTRVVASYAAEPARIALAPPSRVFTIVADFLRPPRSAGLSDDPAIREIEQARDEYQRRWRNAEERINTLQRLLAELQRGRAILPNLAYTPFATPIIARATDPTSGVLTVRGGRDRDIITNAVASTEGVHLVGRVVAVNARTSDIQPITHRATNWMRVSIDPPSPDDLAVAYAQIQPIGEGLLRGEVDSDAPDVQVGQTVRLADNSWPESAQTLVVGEIIEISPKDVQPLRTVITVRPIIDPSRVSQVFLWIPESDSPPTRGRGEGEGLSSAPSPVERSEMGEGGVRATPFYLSSSSYLLLVRRSRSGEGPIDSPEASS
jgi:cell shape-determining protein MreC